MTFPPENQDAIDAEVAGEIKDRVVDWLEAVEPRLAKALDHADVLLELGKVIFTFRTRTAYRYVSKRRTLVLEGLCSVCDYLVPLDLQAPVKPER